jgi:hypothetical protein
MVRLATVADFFFYLRCDACTHVWSHPERRQMMDRRRAQSPSQPDAGGGGDHTSAA